MLKTEKGFETKDWVGGEKKAATKSLPKKNKKLVDVTSASGCGVFVRALCVRLPACWRLLCTV